MVSVAAESIGGAIIHTILSAIRAAISRNFPAVTAALLQLASHLSEITTIMARLPEQCDPMPFYHDVRPFYAGTKNMESAGLPRGVLYDTGDGKGEWKKFRGGNNGQSSLFPLIDLALGIQRSSRTTAKSRECGDDDGAENDDHMDILMYMPSEHRNYLADFAQIWNIHDVINAVEDPVTSEALQAAYVQATTALVQFRSKHLQTVSRYIIVPSKKSVPVGHVTGAQPLLVGTSQTQLMPFLKKVRQQTLAASETYSRKE